jgi:hypothetical protein
LAQELKAPFSREVADKIHILAKDHDAMALALERALERFGGHLHFEGNRAGAQTLVDIVVTHDLQVTFADDRLNAQIQLRRVQNDLDRGRPASIAELEQTSAQKRGAGVSGVNRLEVIKAYDVLVKSPEDRKKFERTAPLLVAARDQVVVQLKREKLIAELNQRNLQNHNVRSMKL